MNKDFKKMLAITGLRISLVVLTTVTFGIPKLIKVINNKIAQLENQTKEE